MVVLNQPTETMGVTYWNGFLLLKVGDDEYLSQDTGSLLNDIYNASPLWMASLMGFGHVPQLSEQGRKYEHSHKVISHNGNYILLPGQVDQGNEYIVSYTADGGIALLCQTENQEFVIGLSHYMNNPSVTLINIHTGQRGSMLYELVINVQ